MQDPKSESESSPTKSEMLAIIDRAQSGDREALPELRRLIARVPAIRGILGAELNRRVEGLLARSLGEEDDLAFGECVKQQLASMRTELEGPTPTPAERLLVDRIIACWLQVQHADLIDATAGNCTLAQAEYLSRRQDRAHRRFLSATKTLAAVRKLASRPVQVNIAENQVNVSSSE